LLVYDSAQQRSALVEELRDVVRYRHLLTELVARNVKTRYKRSVLGVVWTMLNPLVMMTILAVVFSNLFRVSIEHYSVYLLSALVIWGFFAQTTSSVMSELVWGGSLLTRIHVPPAIFALSGLGTCLVNLLLALVPLGLIMVATGVPLTPALLFIPVPIICTSMFALGVGLVLSRLAVLFADVVHMWEILLTAWMYATPIIYPPEIIPDEYRWLFLLNPVYHLLAAFRAPIYDGRLPEADTVLLAVLSSTFALLAGWWYFARKAHEFAYRI